MFFSTSKSVSNYFCQLLPSSLVSLPLNLSVRPTRVYFLVSVFPLAYRGAVVLFVLRYIRGLRKNPNPTYTFDSWFYSKRHAKTFKQTFLSQIPL